jgi:hypothetical protein
VDTHQAHTAHPHTAHPETDDLSSRASLQLELRVPERQMIAAFRDGLLRLLHDRTGPFGRAVGVSDNLSIEELPATSDPKGPSLLRLTMSWPTAARILMRSGASSVLREQTRPVPPPAPLDPVEEFVFFPDAPDAVAPLYRELPTQFHASDFNRPQGTARLRMETPVTVVMARNVLAFVREAQDLARAGVRRVGISGLTIRYPMSTSPIRVWTVGLIGASALVIGFVAGSIYLRSAGGTPAEAVQMARVDEPSARTEAVAPMPSPLTEMTPIRTPLAGPLETSLSSVVSPPRSRVRLPAAAESPRIAVTPPAATSDLADAEVTTRRSRVRTPAPAAPAPAAARRPEVMVVRATDIESASSRTPVSKRGVRGTLLVKTDPQGVEVSINGVVHGRTPLMIRDLGAGSRVVRLDLPGYERWSWAVGVVANKQTPVIVKLRPEARRANGAN